MNTKTLRTLLTLLVAFACIESYSAVVRIVSPRTSWTVYPTTAADTVTIVDSIVTASDSIDGNDAIVYGPYSMSVKTLKGADLATAVRFVWDSSALFATDTMELAVLPAYAYDTIPTPDDSAGWTYIDTLTDRGGVSPSFSIKGYAVPFLWIKCTNLTAGYAPVRGPMKMIIER